MGWAGRLGSGNQKSCGETTAGSMSSSVGKIGEWECVTADRRVMCTPLTLSTVMKAPQAAQVGVV